MPTLTTRIAAANKITTAAAVTPSSSLSSSSSSSAATTMATHAANNSFDTTAGAAATSSHSSTAAAAAARATCTFSTNSDYLQHLQQQQHQQQQQPHSQQLQKQQFQKQNHQLPPPPLPTQPQPQLNHHQHYYSHQLHNQQQQQQQHSNSPPPLPPPHPHLDLTGSASGSTVAGSCSVTFNGNAAAVASNNATAANQIVSNGNISNFAGVVTHSNGNGNIMSPTFATTSSSPPTATTTTTTALTTNAFNATATSGAAAAAPSNIMQTNNNKLETSSIAGSNSLNGSIKKSSSSSHASREDVASLGGGSSINSQSTAMHNSSNNNNNNHNNNNSSNNNNNFNNIITKDNPLQNYYNGLGLGVASRNPDNDEDDGLGPLPPKWETAYTERGELYFIDHNTGTSHWLDPRLSKFQKKSLEDCSDNELPYGWEKIEDSLYGTYYIDHVNRRTQYENPVLEAKRRAAEQRKQQKLPPPPQHEAGEGGREGGRGSQAGSSACTDSITINDVDQQRGPPPPPVVGGAEKPHPPLPMPLLPYKFTRNPADMQGERITTTLLKSARGLGITIVGGDDSVEEFLQIKSIVPNGPAWLDGQLQMGDILVYVNDTCVLGFSHHEMVNVFQSIMPGETVTLEVCRGYPLPFDPNDPNTEVVTTIAVDGITSEPEKQRRLLLDLNMDGNYNFLDVSDGAGNTLHDATHKNTPHAAESPGDFMLMKKPEVLTFSIFKGVMGFGFTIADSAYGQKVKKILDRNCCKQLQEGDILLEINAVSVRNKTHIEVVQVLKDCSKTTPTTVKIQRSGSNFNAAAHAGSSGLGNVTKLRKNFIGNASGLFRSKTPTADLYSTQQKEILPIRPKTPLVDTRARARAQTPNNELNDAEVAAATNGIDSAAGVGLDKGRSLATIAADSKSPQLDAKSTNSLQELDVIQQEIPFMDPYPKLVTSLSERLAEATLMNDGMAGGVNRAHGGGAGYHVAVNAAVHANNNNSNNYENQEYVPSSSNHLGNGGDGGGYNPIYGMSPMLPANMSSLNPMHHIANGAQTNSAALYSPAMHLMSTTTTTPAPTYHHESCYCYDCQDYQRYKYRQQQQQQQQQQQHQLPPLQTNYYTLQHQEQQQQQQSLNHHHQQQLQQPQYSPAMQPAMAPTPLQAAHIQNERMQKRVNELLNDRRKVGFSPLETHHSSGNTSAYLHPQQQQQQQHSPAAMSLQQQQSQNNYNYNMLQPILGGGSHINGGSMTPALRQCLDEDEHQFELTEVTLERQALGFGFRIVGGTEEGSQVTVGHIVPGGAADNDHRIATGDEILSIDGINVVNSSHHKVVSLMGEAALRGQVNMILRRRAMRHLMPMSATLRLPVIRYPYDVIVSRHENEGFGFVIISSSNQYYGSTIGKLIPGSPADRCGELKVGDRIIAVNRLEIAGMSHGDVVQLIKESGLHVRLTIGCPKEGNPMLSTSAQASPGSQLSQTQQSSLSSAASAAVPSSLLQPSNATQQQLYQQQPHQQQQQLAKSETPTYFERNAQMSQHPQL